MTIKRIVYDDRSRYPTPAKLWTDDVEARALEQIHNLIKLPFIHKHVAIMPDVHMGYGSTVGSVIPTKGVIIPAAVGVDIGCGMMAVKLNIKGKQLPDNLEHVRSCIEAAVPHGRTSDGGPGDRGAWHNIPDDVARRWEWLEMGWNELCDKHPKVAKANTVKHLGTLGTGNHFIEVCLDLQDNVWVMLHSGSRGVGNRIGSYFIELAKKDMEKWYINLPDKDLSYFPEGTPHFVDYWHAVEWAQNFARINREVMMGRTLNAIERALGIAFEEEAEAINCHHNYVTKENHFGANVFITRKGAVRAREGDLGIIPGSMGTRSYIVRGLGNPQSFNSCSHGAGRRMSRTQAKREFTENDFCEQTYGVECRKDPDLIDEIPGAYKDIDEVMDNQKDLVEVVATLKQVVCVKG